MESRSSLGKDATLSGIRKHQLHGRKKMFIAVAVDEILKLEVLPQIRKSYNVSGLYSD